MMDSPEFQRIGEQGGRQSGFDQMKDYGEAAKNLIDLMDQYGVGKALIMPPPQVSIQMEKVNYNYQHNLEPVEKYSNRLYLVAGGATLNPLIHGTKAFTIA